jgi:hypothetical protein
LLWASDEDDSAQRRVALSIVPETPPPKRKPTDLRKLSEWIKLKREMEARAAAESKD